MACNVPNFITLGRIAILPLIALFLHWAQVKDVELSRFYSFWAMIVFVVAAVSDVVDGFIARRWQQVSLFGKFFDPMADKLLHLTVLIFLIPLGRIEPWLVVVLLSREIFINGLRTVAIGEGLVMDAATLGKNKTAWLNVGIANLVFFYPIFSGTFFEFDTFVVGRFCVWVGLFFSLLSGLQYTIHFVRKIKLK